MDGHRHFNNYKKKHSSWKSSQYNNLEYNSYAFEDTPPIFSDECEKETKDSKGRRIILREVLYEDPDSFYTYRGENGANKLEQQQVMTYNYGLEWNSQNWQKAKEDGEIQEPLCDEIQMTHRKPNQVEKKLKKMLAQPVQTTKAERMMQQMGWQGGALGKHGDGIVEPIAPNASYAIKTVGLGQVTKKAKKVFKEENKEYFDTNVLLHVLDFIKNDSENEIVFDRHLWKNERKRVHNIIETIASADSTVSIDFDTIAQMDIAQEIHNCNNYILTTESEGVLPNRYLCLYKEATDHMFLVTPADLRDEAVDDGNTKELSDIKQSEQKLTAEKETLSVHTNNPVTEDVLNSQSNKEKTEEISLATIVDYFVEFVNDINYKEFRFLGPFKNNEINAINTFVAKCTNNDYGENDKKLKEAFHNEVCLIEIKKDCNGSIVFYKIMKDSRT